MAPYDIITIQWVLAGMALFIRSFTIATNFSNIITMEAKLPIINETMYDAYPRLYTLDMSNQTGFDFPVDQVLLKHDGLSRFLCNNCGVRSIYQMSLSKLPELTHLMLENNSIEYVHPDAFEFNTRLERLNLAGNQISTFNPQATIRHIPGLAMIDLSRNRRFDLNRVAVQGTRLFFFTCNHCHTTYLDRRTLIHMPRLSQLYLSDNGMYRIDDDALMSAKYVKILSVNRNRELTRLNLRSDSLKKLSAEGCSLEGTLDTSKLPMLEHINVRANRLTRMDEHGILQNTNIQAVLLDDNFIKKLPTFLIDLPLNGLKRLCLDRNPFQPCPQAAEAKSLYSSRSLRQSCLDDDNQPNTFENYLPSLSGTAVYKKTSDLRPSSDGLQWNFSNSAIVYIEPDYLQDDRRVTKVIFDDNYGFDFQQSKVFMKNSLIEWISLKNCSITAIYESTFEQLPNLTHLQLQGNNIQSIHSNSLFANNPNLTFLSLSHNNLEFIAPDAFQQLKKLESLHLDWNDRLSSKANVPFLWSTSLLKLSCVHCRFERLYKETLVGLPNLLELNLEHNYIATLDADALQWTKQLKYLNVRHNHLVMFEPNLNRLTQLQTLCLAGNLNFDLEHPKGFGAVKGDIYRMMRLDKECGNDDFSNKLAKLYNVKNRAQLQSTTEAVALTTQNSAAGPCAANAVVLVLIGFAGCFRSWY